MSTEESEEELVDLSAAIEDTNEGGGLDVNEGTPQAEEPKEPKQAERPVLPEDDEKIPEKFRGKSVDEVIKSYQEAEKALGEKNNELGKLRSNTDQEILHKLDELKDTSKDDSPQSSDTLTDDEFFENPKEAVNKALEQSDFKKQIDELTTTLKEQSVDQKKAEFEKKHPDYLQVVQDSNFQDWVNESPVRREMFQEADQKYDFDKANELIDTYKALNGQNGTEESGLSEQDIAATQEAGLERGNSSKNTKKVYSKRQIIDLKKNNPKKYKQMLPDIKAAMEEGRVKS